MLLKLWSAQRNMFLNKIEIDCITKFIFIQNFYIMKRIMKQ